MIRRPPRSTRMTHSFPTRRSSDLHVEQMLSRCRAYRAAAGIDEADDERTATQARERQGLAAGIGQHMIADLGAEIRSEEHTSELQSLMRISYAVFCLKKKKKRTTQQYNIS